MIVRFMQRNQITEQVLPAGLEVKVVSRENHVYGGPRACELEVKGDSADMMELLGWLRNRIEIFDDKGVPLWWGIVNRVEVPVNKVLLVSDLESMANAVKVVYTLTNASGESTGVPRETDWIVDKDSIEKYGRKEMIFSIGDANAIQADVRARIELQERAFPRIFGMPEGNEKAGRIEGIGEWETLGWQYANIPTRLALAYQTSGDGEFQLSAPEIKVAQSFRAATDFRLSDIALYLRKVGGPGDLTVEVLDFVDENMPGDALASVTIPAENIGSSFAWIRGALREAYAMTGGKRYFVAFSSRWCDQDNYYVVNLDRNKGYPEGTFRINVASGWQTDSRDMAFVLNKNQMFLSHGALSALTRRIDNLTSGYAQQVTTTSSKRFAEVGVYLKRVGDPGALTVTLRRDDGDTPGDQITQAAIEALNVGTSAGWVNALFEQASAQPAGKYWLDLSARQADALNYYELILDSGMSYTGGIAMHKPIGLWVDGGADMPFRTSQMTLSASYTTMTDDVLQLNMGQVAIGQTFQLGTTSHLARAKVFLKKFGNPTVDVTVSVVAVDENGQPSGESLASGRIEALDIGTSGQWFTVDFREFPVLTAYTVYGLVISASGLAFGSGYMLQVDGNGAYPGQRAWTKSDENEWEPNGSDIPFMIYGVTAGVGWGNNVDAARKIGGTYSCVGQQFTAGTNAEIVRLEVRVRKGGSPDDLSVGLYSDSSGYPNELLGYFSVDRRTIGENYAWINGWLNKPCAVVSGEKYWIVVSSNQADNTNYYEVGVDSGAGYSGGVLKLEQSGTWALQSFDVPFMVYEPAAWHQFVAGSAVAKLGDDIPMVAQKVVLPSAGKLTSAMLKLKKIGQPGNINVDICKVNNGFPGEVLGTATIYSEDVSPTSAGFVTGAMEKPVDLTAGGDGYFLVVKANGTSSISYYELTMDAAAGYSAGFALVKAGDVWAEGDGDMPFRLYSNDMVETSQQIQSLLTAYGQFFSHVYVDVSSGVVAESFRGGDTDAKVEIEKMLDGGNLDNLRLLARVNYDRTVEVTVQPEEGLNTMVEMRDDGLLWYRTGSKVEPAFDPVGKWISLEPILRSARFTSVISGSQQNFIDSARWDADGKLDAIPAGWENNLARKVRISNG